MQSINDPAYAIFYQFLPEIYEQAKSLICKSQVCQQLLFMNRHHLFNRFQLNYHQIFNNQINPETDIHCDKLIHNWDRELS